MDEKENKEETAESGQEGGKRLLSSQAIQILAGGYLVYIGYSLSSAYLKGAEDSTLAFFAAGILFVICGLVIFGFGVRGALKGKADSKLKDMADQAKLAAGGKAQEDQAAAKTKRSIAERANLVHADEEDDDETDEEEKTE